MALLEAFDPQLAVQGDFLRFQPSQNFLEKSKLNQNVQVNTYKGKYCARRIKREKMI